MNCMMLVYKWSWYRAITISERELDLLPTLVNQE